MVRLYVILAIALVAFTIFALIDCLRTEHSRVRALPRGFWAILIIVLSPFGGILWFLFGRQRASSAGGSARSYAGPLAPDDDPEFLRQIGEDKQRDARIQELEARLAELDDDQNNSKDK